MKVIKESVAKKGISRTYKAGQIILFQGEVPKNAYFIQEGQVKVYCITNLGNEQLVTFNLDGEFFPSSWIFRKSSSSLFYYETMTDCKITEINRDILLDTLSSTPGTSFELIDYLSTNLAAAMIRINALQQQSAKDKIAYTLYYLCQRYNYKFANKQGVVEIPIKLTHQQIAAFIGLTRETTAYEMVKFKKNKILTYNSKSYKINMPKLLELIGEDSFKGISISSS